MKDAAGPIMAKARQVRVRVMWMDEVRIGQQGTTAVSAPMGSRPTAVKQTKYDWVYLYAAAEHAPLDVPRAVARLRIPASRSLCN